MMSAFSSWTSWISSRFYHNPPLEISHFIHLTPPGNPPFLSQFLFAYPLEISIDILNEGVKVFFWESLISICFFYRNDQVSDEMLLYHMLLTLQSKRNQVWELVIDFTHSSEQNRFKVKILFSIPYLTLHLNTWWDLLLERL